MVSALRNWIVLRRSPILIFVLAIFFIGIAGTFQVPAFAQEVQTRTWSLRDLFLPRKRERVEPPAKIRRKPPRVKKQAPAARQPVKPPVQAVEKAPDARLVLVVGDFLAGGLAEGLEAAFEENHSIKIESRSNGSSGLVRDDYYNWPAELPALVESEKPAAIVVMIGSNDRQQLRVGDTSEQPRSEKWTKEYEARVTAFGKEVAKTKVPFIWVGIPAFRFSSMTSDMLAFNEIYRAAAESNGGEFVDIWDGFVDENGAFITKGPDINGQPVNLRGSDGINLTRAGKRKVAFYVEKPLMKILGLATGADAEPSFTPAGLPVETPAAITAPENVDRTAPMLLNDPALDGGTELLGAFPHRDNMVDARQEADGLTTQEREKGRADDFSWPPPKDVTIPLAAPETTTAIDR